jgi:hypothetical protein
LDAPDDPPPVAAPVSPEAAGIVAGLAAAAGLGSANRRWASETETNTIPIASNNTRF